MKNTISINLNGECCCECVTNLGDDANSISIEAICTTYENVTFHVTQNESEEILETTKTNDVYVMTIPERYFSKEGVFTVTAKCKIGTLIILTFTCKNISENGALIVRCVSENSFTVTAKIKNTTGIPIATEATLGVVRGGENVNIRDDGTMYADGISYIESITNSRIDEICT